MGPPPAAASAAAWDALALDGLLDDAMNETDALLMELLREPPTRSVAWESESPPAEHELNPREALCQVDKAASVSHPAASKRPRSVLYHNKTKDAIATLRDEVSHLTSELTRLRSETSAAIEPSTRTAKETAIDERLKRRRVEDECRQLREAVYAQTQFIRGLKSVFSTPLPLGPMDLTHYLHNYTKLPRDRSTRWNEYATLAQEARFQSAMDILCRETQKMHVKEDEGAGPTSTRPSADTPFVHTEVLHLAGHGSDGFGVTSISVYAVETNDLSAALRGVCVAVSEIVATSHAYECFGRKRQLVDVDMSLPSAGDGSSITYRVMGVDHQIDDHHVAVESHNVTLYKQTENFALLLEDFVDHDELHPEDEDTNVTRQAVGAYLMRRETCDDGVERMVCRVMRTRHYRFHHEHTPRAVLERFQQLSSASVYANDLLIRQLIHESITTEEAAYAQALRQLEACVPAAAIDS